MDSNFTIGNIFGKAWSVFAKNWMVLLGLLIAYIIVDMITSSFVGVAIDIEHLMQNPEDALSTMTDTFGQPSYYLGLLISMILSTIFTLVFTKTLLDAYDEQELTFYFDFKKFLYIFLANILYGIIVAIGVVCFIIPGIFFALRLQFFAFAIIEKDATPIEALRKSWQLSKGKTLPLLTVGLLMLAIAFAGAMLFLVGIIPALVIIYAAQAAAYKLLTEEDEEVLFDNSTY